MVQALIGRHDVATLTEGAWDTSETNSFYGTSIPADAVTQHVARIPWRWLSALPEHHITRLRMCAVLRHAATLASQFDLLIGADNFAPFPKRGIQYVHFPARLQPAPARMHAVVHRYFELCDRVLGASWGRAADNLTLVNSQWSADGLARLGEVPMPIVVYPPVLDPGAGLPWSERDDTFLCVGRFHGSKRIEAAISIVREARAHAMPDAKLVIVGSPVDLEYSARIRMLASPARDWIELREDLPREQLNRLMGRARYAIQAMAGEHFGMATAEMTRAGCLVFAHNSGGSPEVLNHEEALLWSTEEDAVRKVAALGAIDVEPLRRRLQTNAQRFSPEAFIDRVRTIVADAR